MRTLQNIGMIIEASKPAFVIGISSRLQQMLVKLIKKGLKLLILVVANSYHKNCLEKFKEWIPQEVRFITLTFWGRFQVQTVLLWLSSAHVYFCKYSSLLLSIAAISARLNCPIGLKTSGEIPLTIPKL